MPSQSFTAYFSLTALTCVIAFGAAGCAHEKVHATVPVATAPVAPSPDNRPMTVAPDTDAMPPVEAESAPPAINASAAPPQPITIAPPLPPAPRKRAAEHAAPQISPQISPTDQSLYAKKTAGDVATAEHNLQQTNGRRLSAAQQDLADKIRSFVSQSRDASKSGD